MNQIIIGQFIAAERKRKGYTQKQLAEILCNELQITVNELLTGERVSEDDYWKKAEENMVNLVKEAQESRKKIILSAAVAGLSVVAAAPLFVLPGLIEISVAGRIVLIGLGVIILIFGIAIACILDRDAGAFECPECKERFVPEMNAYIMGPHTITRRKLTCPKCGAKKYCKHVLTR